MYYTKLFDNNLNKRRQNFENYLDVLFPNTISNLICNYDCYLEGKSFTVDCFPDEPQRTFDNIRNRTIRCMFTLHDGRIVIGGDSICKIINQNGSCEAIFSDFSGSVSCITELYDGRIVIASGIYITNLQIWNPLTGKCDMRLQNYDAYITKIIVLFDGRIMGYCACQNDKWKIVFKIWNPLNGCVDSIFSDRMSKCYTVDSCINLFPNGQILVVTNHHTLALWNPQTKNIHIISKDEYNHMTNAILLTDGRIIVSQTNKITIYTNTKQKLHKKVECTVIDNGNDTAYHLVELPDERFACLNYGSQLKIYHLNNNKCEMVLQTSEKHFITGMTVLPNGQIVYASQEGFMTIWT